MPILSLSITFPFTVSDWKSSTNDPSGSRPHQPSPLLHSIKQLKQPSQSVDRTTLCSKCISKRATNACCNYTLKPTNVFCFLPYFNPRLIFELSNGNSLTHHVLHHPPTATQPPTLNSISPSLDFGLDNVRSIHICQRWVSAWEHQHPLCW